MCGGSRGREFILPYIWTLEKYVWTCAHTLTLSQYIPPEYPSKIYKFFRQYSDTYIDTVGGYCEYFLSLRWSKSTCYSFSLNGLWLDGMWEHWPGLEFYWCSVLFSSQQFSALTEVLFHFLTEPKEVKYVVIRRVSGCGSTVLRCLESDILICVSLSAGGKVSGSALWICHHQSDESWPPQKHCEKLPSGSKWWVASVSNWGQRDYLNIPSVHRVGKHALGTEPEDSVVSQTWAGITDKGGKPGR